MSVWIIASGKRLVGPLKQNDHVTGIRFSPNGKHIAAACCGNSVRVFDSRTGRELIDIKPTLPPRRLLTPLAWSNDGRRIFAVSDKKVKCFEVSTGSLVAESQILEDSSNRNGLASALSASSKIVSIALATNGKFIATYIGFTICFLDALTLTQLGPVIEDSALISSITLPRQQLSRDWTLS